MSTQVGAKGRWARSVSTAALVAATVAWWPGQPGAVTATTDETVACSRVWIGREAEFEEYLRTAPIDRIEEVPIGVTKPKRAFFVPGGLAASAAWKPLRPGMHSGYYESYKSEIAAYEIDKLIGLHMVPPTVERRIENDLGAVVLWVENVKGWKMTEPVTGPDANAWNKQVIAMKMLDNLIGNIDRNQGNLLYDAEYHLILIDHSRAFTSVKRLPSPMTRIWKDLYDKFNGLTLEQLQPALGPWVGKGELKAIIERRDRIRKEVEKSVAEKGAVAVFVN